MQSIKVRCLTLPKGLSRVGHSFDKVGQHHIKCSLVNVRAKKDDKGVFICLVNYF